LKLGEIARLFGASHILGSPLAETEPGGLAIDSRSVRAGDLFIAIPGERVDGHEFTREVIERGACAAVVSHRRLAKDLARDLGAGQSAYLERLIFVDNTVCALQLMARRVIERWSGPIVGITGSAGKTTIKELAAHVLSAKERVLKSLGNLNTTYGLPLTVGRMIVGGAKPEDFDLAVLEMGMSSFGEIARLVDMAPPNVGVVGNVGSAHIEFFGSVEAIARAKAELVDGIEPGGTAVLNFDDRLVREMAGRRNDISVVSFAIDAAAAVKADEIAPAGDLSGTRFRLTSNGQAANVDLPLLGRHNIYNALAAAAVGTHFGISLEVIAERLSSVTVPAMRGELLQLANGVTLIDDSYNSNPQALREAARAVAQASGFKRRIIVAGEMLELGASGAELHRESGRAIAGMGVDLVIGVRGLARELTAAAKAAGVAAHFAATPEEAADYLVSEARDGDVILIKASRGVRAERIVEKLRSTFGSSAGRNGGGAGGV
jgi:UDP-N-acetylmuramoyl-tripeptide--D-alanyl-D-alanine ligase